MYAVRIRSQSGRCFPGRGLAVQPERPGAPESQGKPARDCDVGNTSAYLKRCMRVPVGTERLDDHASFFVILPYSASREPLLYELTFVLGEESGFPSGNMHLLVYRSTQRLDISLHSPTWLLRETKKNLIGYCSQARGTTWNVRLVGRTYGGACKQESGPLGMQPSAGLFEVQYQMIYCNRRVAPYSPD
jgi:hypothetical protein